VAIGTSLMAKDSSWDDTKEAIDVGVSAVLTFSLAVDTNAATTVLLSAGLMFSVITKLYPPIWTEATVLPSDTDPAKLAIPAGVSSKEEIASIIVTGKIALR